MSKNRSPWSRKRLNHPPGPRPGGGIHRWDYPGTTPIPGRLGSWGRAGSLHPGGANFLLGGGSTRFLREATDRTVPERLGAMADGAVTPIPD